MTYALQVDWNNDGDFSDANEDVTSKTLGRTRLTLSRGRDQIRQLSPPSAGRLDAELLNIDKLFSPAYSAGALYGNLLPGRPVRLRKTVGVTTYDLWRGFLENLKQNPDRMHRSVSLTALGGLSKLVSNSDSDRISTALYSSITTDVALGYILDAVGWPAGDRVLDTGKTTLDWWWLQSADPLQAAVKLVATEGPGAALYEDSTGRIVFESRHYRMLTARCTTSQETYRDTGAEPLHSEPFVYDEPWQDVINDCTLEIKVRTAKASGVVWTLGSNVTLAGSETRKIVASNAEPFNTALFVAATDYTVSSGSLTTASLDRTSGQSVTITLTAGAAGATVTGIQLRAQLVSTDNTLSVSNTIDTSTSKARYGTRAYPLGTLAEIPASVAQDFANAVVAYYQEPRGLGSITVKNGNTTRFAAALGREISDRITVVEAQTGLDGDAFVERIGHAVSANGKLHETAIGFERADNINYWILGTSLLGVDTMLGY